MKAKLILLTMALCLSVSCYKTTECSWYGEELRDKPMANGKLFDPDLPIIASWDYDFHTVLEIHYNGRVVRGVVLDRGPARRLYHQGRKLDISESLFRKLVGSTDAGVVEVKYRPINDMEVIIKW